MTRMDDVRHKIQFKAVVSKCGEYRYRLMRDLSGGFGPGLIYRPMLFIMLNPSTADAKKDDPTIRRCKGFASREGATHLVVVNLYAFRETSPKLVKAAMRLGVDVVGPENLRHVSDAITECRGMPIIVGWGAHDFLGDVPDAMRDLIIGLRGVPHCLGRTKKGFPRHPLFVKKVQPLELF